MATNSQGSSNNLPLWKQLQTSIAASPDFVFDRIAVHSLEKWAPMLKSFHITGQKGNEPQPGSVRHCAIKGMGNMKEIFVTYDRASRIALKMDSPMLPLEDSLWILDLSQQNDGSTKLIWSAHAIWKPGLKTLMMRPMMGLMLDTAIRNLKKHCETEYSQLNAKSSPQNA